jgi:hypothetical protein
MSTFYQEHQGPAHRIYVFDRGWRVFRAVIRHQFARAGQSADLSRDHARTVQYLAFTRLGLLKYPAQLVILALHIAIFFHYLLAVLIAVMFVSIYVPILLLLGLITMSFLLLLATLDRCNSFFRRLNGFACYCPGCYLQTYSPRLLCPDCNTACSHLRPDLHGILFHHCESCNKHLPTVDWLGRKKLERICPRCLFPLPLATGTTVTSHIALVGGISSGKTTCLVTSLHTLLTIRGRNADFLDCKQRQDFELSLKQLAQGEALPDTIDTKPSTIMLSLRSPRELLYLYDPAGKDFAMSGGAYQHKYYQHCKGLFFIIDPFSIRAFYHHHQARIEQDLPEQRPAEPEVGHLYTRMMSTLEVCTGLRPDQSSHQSLAVVVSRANYSCLEEEIGESTIRAFIQRQASPCSEANARHLLVRQFLCRYHLEHMVRDLEMHFSSVRYFTLSTRLFPIPDRSLAPDALAWLLQNGRR